MTKNWIRVDISCGAAAADDLGAELADSLGVSVEFIPEGLRIYFDSALFARNQKMLREIIDSASETCHHEIPLSFSEIPDEDWSRTWKAHFKPLRVGRRFLIAPTWESVEPGPEVLVIRIDPGRAFGTGHHETTRLCLEWLEAWAEAQKARSAPPGSILDVGTGSGILAIGAGLLGFVDILGIDNDPDAVEVAVLNAELNPAPGNIRFVCATPDGVPGLFDVLISNIQALPLIRMSGTLVSKVRAGGKLVLSGILAEQADEVRKNFETKGAVHLGTRAAGEWVLLDFTITKRNSDE